VCLAIPGRITAIQADGRKATVDLAGNTLTVDVSLIEAPSPGDWVIVHAGFALEKLDAEAARETLALARELSREFAEETRAEGMRQ